MGAEAADLLRYLPSILVGAFGVVAFIIFKYFENSKVYTPDGKLIPGPKSNFFGQTFFGVMKKARRDNQASQMMKDVLLPKFGDGNIMAVRVLGTNMAVISHPDMIKQVLSGNHNKFPKAARYDRFKFILGDGLIVSSGQTWQTHRTMINPSFHAEELRSFVDIFAANTMESVEKMRKFCVDGNAGRIDFNKEMVILTTKIICESAFGYKFVDNDEKSELFQSMGILNDELNERVIDFTDWWHMLFPERTARVKRAADVVFNLIDSIVQDRLAGNKDKTNRGFDLLDVLLQSSKDVKLTPKELRDHLMTFFAAGHETTSTTLLWVFYELTKRPEIMARCVKEVDEIFANKTTDYVEYDDINKFTYLHQVLKESLRYHPPVPSYARRTVEDVQLGEYILPRDSMIVICVMAAQRHKDFWDKPDEFDPERFSPERAKATIKNPFQFIPFSAGPRNCIGQRFANMEAMTVFATFLYHFKFELKPEDDAKIVSVETVSCQPKNVFLYITPRKH